MIRFLQLFFLCLCVSACDVRRGEEFERRMQLWKAECMQMGYSRNSTLYQECMIKQEGEYYSQTGGVTGYGSRLKSWYKKCSEYGYTADTIPFQNCVIHQERKYKNSIIKWH